MTSPNSVRLHRVLKAPPEAVFRAFVEPAALVKWMAPHGFVAQVHSIDARAGGSYRMSFANFRTGQTHAFGGTYKEVKPGELLRYNDKFDDPNLPDEMTMTISFRKVSVGTELSIVQENIPPMIPAEMCYLGWQESLTLLTLLVEADVP
ncbi:MAG TPA: SRPBCC family protein [Phycisphaerales bacterium]|nr:SRPBCC family protein [Phycisphaerales bacterium]